MKKRYSAITVAIATAFLLSAVVVWSQADQPANGEANPPEVLSIDLLEDPSLWAVYISSDEGYSTHRSFANVPSATVSPDDGTVDVNNGNVLGIKTDFIRRGFTEIFFKPLRPIPVPGEVTDISLRVSGRDLQYELCVRVRDINLKLRELCSMEKLNFRGWQQVNVQIPPDVQQYDPRRPLDTGLEFVSIVVRPLYTEAYGTHYVYFDGMQATTDVSIITTLVASEDPTDLDEW